MKSLVKFCSTSLLVALFATIGLAQVSDSARNPVNSRYIISAKAGGVNLTEGDVTIQRKDATFGYLVKGSSVKVGERIFTKSNSRVELLLNPGSFARLDQNSEFEFLTTSLENLKLKLHRGSAIFEVYAGNGFTVKVETPTSRFYLIKSGVYRIDVLENGISKIEVRRGKAQVGDINATKLKKGKAAVVNNEQVAIAKFQRKDRDDFENWSRLRAKGLAKANARLQRNNVRNALWRGYTASRWNTYDSFGVWAYSPRFGSYCFLPFGYGWRSPYGFNLSRDLFYFRLPRVVYYSRPIVRTGETNASTNNNGNTSRRTVTSRRTTRPTPSGVRRSPGSVSPRRTPSTGGRTRIGTSPRRTTVPRRPVRSTPSIGGSRRKVSSRDLNQ